MCHGVTVSRCPCGRGAGPGDSPATHEDLPVAIPVAFHETPPVAFHEARYSPGQFEDAFPVAFQGAVPVAFHVGEGAARAE